MRGPYVITNLPNDLSNITYELILELYRIALARGTPGASLARYTVAHPRPLTISVSTRPDHARIMISRQAGRVVASEATMIFLTIDGHNYLVIENDVTAEELRRLVEDPANPT